MSATDQHGVEVARGERFEFGKNWSRFLKDLTVARIRLAENSLKTALKLDRLDGMSFLDIGSGSGLFSLCARRLGAKVRSFDYDPNSVACTRELRRRYFPDDRDWTVEQASVLDKGFLATLGTYDVVYSWGVLHHTGAMYEALENVKPLVPVGGRLFIAIYNDLGAPTDEWERIKRRYNQLPQPLAHLFALGIMSRDEVKAWQHHRTSGGLKDYLRTWTEYDRNSTRGMSKWHDWIDWIGGYPYERATVEQIVDFYAPDGFKLDHLLDLSQGYGCNEFVFQRIAPAGTFVESRVSGGNSMARQLGHRLVEPYTVEADGIYAQLRSPGEVEAASHMLLIRDNRIVGETQPDQNGRVRLAAPDADPAAFRGAPTYLVPAEVQALPRPFGYARGHMWTSPTPDFHHLADDESNPRRSTLFVFEDGVQLPLPHAPHDEIDRDGGGRFSHWGTSIYFSALDGGDPNTNGKDYKLLTRPLPLPPERSFAQRYGVKVTGPFQRGETGWTAALPPGLQGTPIIVLRNDRIVAVQDAGVDPVVVAALGTAPDRLDAPAAYVVAGSVVGVAACGHQRGHLWNVGVAGIDGLGDDAMGHQSPVFMFEDGRQLPFPHKTHDEIAQAGGGMFSCWDRAMWFSTTDGSDPNSNGRTYVVAIPARHGPGAAA